MKKVRTVVVIGCAIQFVMVLFVLITLPIRSSWTYAFFTEQPVSYFCNGILSIVQLIVACIIGTWPMEILSPNNRIFAELPSKKKKLIEFAGIIYTVLILALCIDFFVVL